MEKYLLSLLPRLKQYGKNLDRIEFFVDKTWVGTSDGFLCTYRFLRNGKLLITVSGETTEWSWEILPPNSVYIKNGTQGKMFRHAFVLDGVLMMQKEGNDDYFIFYNESIVTDGDVKKYIENTIQQKLNLHKLNTGNGYYFTNPNNDGLEIGSLLYDDEFSLVGDGTIPYKDCTIVVKDGKVVRFYKSTDYVTDKGVLKIVHSVRLGIEIGNAAYINEYEAPDGKYLVKGGGMYSFNIKDGKVKDFSSKSERSAWSIIGIVVVSIVVVMFVLVIVNKKNDDHRPEVVSTSVVVSTNDRDTVFTPSFVYTNDDVIKKFGEYIDAINKRNFDALGSLLSPVLVEYYSQKNLGKDDVVNNLKQYWSYQPNYTAVLFEKSDINVNKLNTQYQLSGEVVERSVKPSNGLPYFYKYTLYIVYTDNLLINSIENKITEVVPDIYNIFQIPENATIEDIKMRNRIDDQQLIIDKLTDVVYNTPTQAKDYVDALEYLYPAYVISIDNSYLSVSSFIDLIKESATKPSYIVYDIKNLNPEKVVYLRKSYSR